MTTNTCGGGIDQTAIIGHAPEMRDWKPGDPAHQPILRKGVRVEAFVTIDAGAEWPTLIGARSWLMKHSHVGHDVTIGADCEVAPGAVIGGYCVIGDRVKIGINACLKPGVMVGDDARIGMGAVVVKDVPAGVTVVGNPARPL
jgi:acyl-[acyl carrier protein]--UDP-N-acetylglucosamine O-acyltransferase